MANIFLDCGAHCGCSVRYFRSEFDPDHNWKVVSFEPNPIMRKFWDDFIEKAVSTFDGPTTLYQYYKTGGSTIEEKKDYILLNKFKKNKKKMDAVNVIDKEYGGKGDITKENIRNVIQCECIDLDRYIRETFNKDDFIWLKLDVEGSEYKIIKHMIKNKSIEYINKLSIEWHGLRVGVKKVVEQDLVKKIRKYDIEITPWNSLKPAYCKFPY